MNHQSKGVVLYDFFRVAGGAEQVSLDLARHFAADLYIGFDSPGVAATLGYEASCDVTSLGLDAPTLPLRSLRLIRGFRRQKALLEARPWVVYSGTFAPLAVHDHPQGRNILYCHALPRFIYDLRAFYEATYSGWRRPLLHGLIRFLQPRYEAAVDAMDLLVANSGNVQGRIRRYLGKESVVVFPPCAIEDKQWLGQEGYYLSLARIEPYKRVDKLIAAFLQMPDKNLVVASGGSDYDRLRALAGDAKNIRFTGWLDKAGLGELIGNAIATLYIPQDEDFGMSPVESMAAGKPVIGVREGGLLETVVPGETGILIAADPQIEEIIAAVESLTAVHARDMRETCEARAKLFSREIFFEKMEQLIGN